jgi:phage protein D/phage baseplate assembly protein gpV
MAMNAMTSGALFDLSVDGSRLPERLARALTSLRVHQHLSLPSACEITLTGIDAAQALQVLAPGAKLRIAARTPADDVLFEGSISAIELAHGADRIVTAAVRAYDALLSLRNRQSPRTYVGLSAEALAKELVADLGVVVRCDEPGPAWPRLLQTGSDFDLLADIAQRSGLYFQLQDGVLWLHSLRGRDTTLELTLHDELQELRFEANAHGAAQSVDVVGWDPWRGRGHRASADSARSGRSASLQPDSGVVGGGDARCLSGRCLQDDAQALALAQADLDLRRARSLVMWGTATGHVRLAPGVKLRIAGVAAALAGEHVLSSVRHIVEPERGYRCELSSEVPARPPRERGLAMAFGEVARIDDPEHLGRVQVRLASHGDLGTDWLQIMGVGAGTGKGLVASPDVGDRVLALIDRDDPAQAVVLGSLWAEEGLPEDQGGLGERASFCFVTPGGHRLRLDDGERKVRLSAVDGSSVEMGPQRMSLHAATPMTIEAPGQTLTIRAAQIDFERA